MTLDKAVVKICKSATKPGVAFVALSRVRHPDDLMLDDSFPAMSNFMRQRANVSFLKRQKWERRMRVKFAKTLRKYVRTEEWGLKEPLWTEETSQAADELLRFLTKHKDLTDDCVLPEFFRSHSAAEDAAPELEKNASKQAMYTEVWQRLHTYPYSCEIQAARGVLDTEAQEKQRQAVDQPQAPWRLQTVTRKNWRVPAHEWLELIDTGSLSVGALELFNQSFVRGLLRKNMKLYNPFFLQKYDGLDQRLEKQ